MDSTLPCFSDIQGITLKIYSSAQGQLGFQAVCPTLSNPISSPPMDGPCGLLSFLVCHEIHMMCWWRPEAECRRSQLPVFWSKTSQPSLPLPGLSLALEAARGLISDETAAPHHKLKTLC